MATSCSLGLVKGVAVERVLAKLQEFVGGESLDEGHLAVLPGLVVSAAPVERSLTQEIFHDDWGLDVLTLVFFALGYQADPELRYHAEGLMSLAAAQLVVEFDTDAGMTYENERKLLGRRDGVLALYSWWPQWSEPGSRNACRARSSSRTRNHASTEGQLMTMRSRSGALFK